MIDPATKCDSCGRDPLVCKEHNPPWEPPADPRVPEEAWAVWPLYVLFALLALGMIALIVWVCLYG